MIVGDKLYFYYTAFQGDERKKSTAEQWSGMYANASTGLAVLRRDGFASMEAGGEERMLFTRPLRFSGKFLFLNIESHKGSVHVAVCSEDGEPIPGYSREECLAITTDSTKLRVRWKDHENLDALKGKNVRFKFYLFNAAIYSFWVSANQAGNSGGATAAGGPGIKGYWDV
jgi:hypothetical protein